MKKNIVITIYYLALWLAVAIFPRSDKNIAVSRFFVDNPFGHCYKSGVFERAVCERE